MLPIGLCVQTACIWEATARKVGNVHRFSDFADASYVDFLLSAAAVAPVLENASRRRVGDTILDAVQATRRIVSTNTNLGILLLLAPLAAVPRDEDLRSGVASVLGGLDVADARAAYEAIRLAAPGGLGRAAEEDVADEPTRTLREVMALAADRDLIARQYADGFAEVFTEGVPALRRGLEHTASVEEAIVFCQLHLLATFPDSLIVRKRGLSEAKEAGRRARDVLAQNWPHDTAGWAALAELDAWLRAEGNGRNPGTTADLIAACLFVLLRQDTITLPPQYPWSAGWHHG